MKRLVIGLFTVLFGLLTLKVTQYVQMNPVDRSFIYKDDTFQKKEKDSHRLLFLKAQLQNDMNIPTGQWIATSGHTSGHTHHLNINPHGGFVWSIFKENEAIGMTGYWEITGQAIKARNVQGKGRSQLPINGNIIIQHASENELHILDHNSMTPLKFARSSQ